MSRFFALVALLLFSSLAYSQKLSGVVKAGGPSAVVLEPISAKPSSAPSGLPSIWPFPAGGLAGLAGGACWPAARCAHDARPAATGTLKVLDTIFTTNVYSVSDSGRRTKIKKIVRMRHCPVVFN